jgi:hypothetical protein
LCGKDIVDGGLDIMEFHFHKICAENVAMVLRQAKAYNTWRSASPSNQGFHLTA